MGVYQRYMLLIPMISKNTAEASSRGTVLIFMYRVVTNELWTTILKKLFWGTNFTKNGLLVSTETIIRRNFYTCKLLSLRRQRKALLTGQFLEDGLAVKIPRSLKFVLSCYAKYHNYILSLPIEHDDLKQRICEHTASAEQVDLSKFRKISYITLMLSESLDEHLWS
jgi:hypothetical protein